MNPIDWFKSEAAYLSGALRTLKSVTPVGKNPDRVLPDVMDEIAAAHAEKPALVGDGETLTYRDYNGRANRYARWAMANGVEKGDTVALLMPNRPEYYAVWLGIARAGGVTALLNTNLTGSGLAHCINIVKPKHVIVDARLAEAFDTAAPQLEDGPRIWGTGIERDGWTGLDSALAEQSADNIPADQRPKLTIEDRCLYIYTSGTTGLPKAANINHYRVQSIMYGFAAATSMTNEDRLYVCLPLYHSTGLLVAGGAALSKGACVVIREKFSARQFWDDVVDNECSMFAYVGELCRYLLNSPPHPKETRHKLRLVFGNGLRPDIWSDFKSRFRIPQILEWYAATEGNAVLFNFDEKAGYVGRIPGWAKRRFLIEVVKFDVEKEMPLRDETGRCIKCAPGEVGEVISQIVNDPTRPSQRFEGYSDKAATNKKILRDVFKPGDAWFRTGDLMKQDQRGYFQFIDRIGDTYRWKGENVATSEVSETLTLYPGVKEANVYGVAIPGKDGRAGMVALVVGDDFDLKGLGRHVEEKLPPYARPLFVRIQDELDVTGTFKQRKVELVKEGFDPASIKDPLFFLDPKTNAYVPLDEAAYKKIQGKKIKL